MDTSHFVIHLSADRHLAHFHFSAIMNTAALNTRYEFCVGLLGHVVIPCLTFLGANKLFPTAAVPFNAPTSTV